MRRKVIRVIAAAMAVIMLAGCTAAPGNGTSDQTTAATAAESKETSAAGTENTADNSEAVTIKMTYLTSGTEPEGLDRIEAALSELTMKKINCKVELVPVAFADQATKYNMWFANGNDTDIMITVFLDYLAMINSGAFTELDDLILEHGQEMLKKDEEKNFLSAGQYKGHQYGIPTIPSAPGNGGAIYIREDVFNELDVSGIDTNGYIGYEDLDKIFNQISEKFPQYTALGVSGNRTKSNYFYVKNYDNLGVSGESGGVLIDPLNNTTVENLYATDSYHEYLTWMRKWYEAGYISKDAATSSESSDTLFNSGKTASYINMSTPGTRESAERDAGFGVVQLNMCPTYMTTNVYTGVLFFVPKNAKYPEKAVEFLNILFTDAEIQNVLTHGEEGIDYTVQDNGVVIDLNEDRDYINVYGVWGDQSQYYMEAPLVPEDTQKREAYLQESLAHTSKAFGYKFDATPVSTEQSMVKSVIAKYLTQLEYGTVDLDTVYPEFLKALESAGIDKIIAENQRQLDEWIAQQK